MQTSPDLRRHIEIQPLTFAITQHPPPVANRGSPSQDLPSQTDVTRTGPLPQPLEAASSDPSPNLADHLGKVAAALLALGAGTACATLGALLNHYADRIQRDPETARLETFQDQVTQSLTEIRAMMATLEKTNEFALSRKEGAVTLLATYLDKLSRALANCTDNPEEPRYFYEDPAGDAKPGTWDPKQIKVYDYERAFGDGLVGNHWPVIDMELYRRAGRILQAVNATAPKTAGPPPVALSPAPKPVVAPSANASLAAKPPLAATGLPPPRTVTPLQSPPPAVADTPDTPDMPSEPDSPPGRHPPPPPTAGAVAKSAYFLGTAYELGFGASDPATGYGMLNATRPMTTTECLQRRSRFVGQNVPVPSMALHLAQMQINLSNAQGALTRAQIEANSARNTRPQPRTNVLTGLGAASAAMLLFGTLFAALVHWIRKRNDEACHRDITHAVPIENTPPASEEIRVRI